MAVDLNEVKAWTDEARALVAELDSAPLIIRSRPEAKRARDAAVSGMAVVKNLLIEAGYSAGVENGG